MKKRIISAIVALIIVIPLIVLGGIPYYIGMTIVGVIAFYEMTEVFAKEKKIPVYVKLAILITYLCMIVYGAGSYEFSIDHKLIILNIFMCMLPLVGLERKAYDADDALKMLAFSLLLAIAFNFMIVIRNISLYYLLYVLTITICSDTFAHFVGTMIGKHKLCPHVSPNKTVEGLIGGVFFGTFLGSVFFMTLINANAKLFLVVLISFILSLISELGDLIFSAIKRKYGVKDYGNIMPAHGGVLDRLDSSIFAILAFSYLVSLF
jgi:phosphatidate cytidylyltransferase